MRRISLVRPQLTLAAETLQVKNPGLRTRHTDKSIGLTPPVLQLRKRSGSEGELLEACSGITDA